MIRRYRAALALLACVLGLLLWAALAPLGGKDRALLYEIPKGAWQQRMAGDRIEPLPGVIHLTLGVKDVLLLRNRDSAPQMFGPVMIMPGREFRMPFADVSTQRIPFTARISGEITVIVAAHPTPGLERLRWRLGTLSHALRYYKIVKPG